MRAVQIDHYGSVDVLQVRDVPAPEPGPDDVVVRVLATSINPGEAQIRAGGMASDDDRFPMGQGSDLAGRIAQVGAGVSGWAVGDEVIAWSDERAAQAELVAVPASRLVRKPAALGWAQAGSLYVAGGTAWALRGSVTLQGGDTVVVTAAAGGVGTFLVQLLVQAGARVLGVAGPASSAWLRGVGVEPVATGDALAERLRVAAPDGVAAFLDCYGHGYTDLALELGVARDQVSTIADFAAASQNGTRVVLGYQAVDPFVMASLADLVAGGRIDLPVAATFPLEQVREAYTQLAQGHTHGKIVLVP